MRNQLLTLIILFVANFAIGQTEIKINPLGLLFGDISVAGEFGLAEKFGLEPMAGLFTIKSGDWKLSSARFGAIGKFYLNPNKGLDGFHIGPYMRFATGKWKLDTESTTNRRLAIGFYLGYKWVTNGGLVFELGAGGGRNIVNKIGNEGYADVPVLNVDLMFRTMIGYRFGGGDSGSMKTKK